MARNYRSELVGAFGCPIDENLTGVMEEAAFAAKGLDYRYLTVKVEPGDLRRAMDGVRAFHRSAVAVPAGGGKAGREDHRRLGHAGASGRVELYAVDRRGSACGSHDGHAKAGIRASLAQAQNMGF
jgi:hypothetical protein